MFPIEEDDSTESSRPPSKASSNSVKTKIINDKDPVREEKPQDDKDKDSSINKEDTTPDNCKCITPSELSDLSSMEDTEEDYKSSAKYSSSTSERTPSVFKVVTPEQRKQRLLKLMEEINKGGRYCCEEVTEKLD